MSIINQADFDNQVAINKDPYGACIVKLAGRAMEILDEEPGDFDCHALICRADKEIKAGGITSFMAGAAAQIISHCHSRGEEFRKKWNGEYGVKPEDDKGGVVNPAILTMKS